VDLRSFADLQRERLRVKQLADLSAIAGRRREPSNTAAETKIPFAQAGRSAPLVSHIASGRFVQAVQWPAATLSSAIPNDLRPWCTNVVRRLNSHVPLVFTDTDFQRLAQFDPHELLRLFEFLKSRLSICHRKDVVVSVRLPAPMAESVEALSFKRKTTRSDIVRRAVIEFGQRNPV
jgi:ribbon-helix-helix CopG family protein